MTDYQKIAALHKMEPIGGQKPSELLASMLELCPRGHETSIFFTHLFLERLPAELRITLGEDDHQNVRALAKKADSLWSLHGMKSSFASTVASLVDVEEPSPVAVVSSRGSGRGRARGRGGRGSSAGTSRGGSQQPGGQQAPGQSRAASSLLPREMARIQSGLCLYHFNHGDKAHSCTPPCNWGN
jgi:site-specific DNA-cytosine methylase